MRLTSPPIRKPPRIRAGDLVGVVAPSGAVNPERLRTGVEVLEAWGFRVRLGAGVLERHRYFAGDDEVRRADLEQMLVDPEVRAVFCARGGYGSQRLVPSLDLRPLAAAPKLVVGYSDASALLGAIVTAGILAVHGPMVADDLARGLAARAETHLRALLTDDAYLWQAEIPESLRAGRAEGRLLGGCLSVLVTLLGTPHAPDTDGAVLFLEDVRERPYRLDRLLTQLRQAGKLDRLAGLVFGTMSTCPVIDGTAPLDVVRDCCDGLDFPIGFGLPSGHDACGSGCVNLALPLGARVALDTERGLLTALEPAVV
jgi:muramoyltetrapeptide carboxypeptidase